jgi:hypothetical protein
MACSGRAAWRRSEAPSHGRRLGRQSPDGRDLLQLPGEHDHSRCYRATYKVPENGALLVDHGLRRGRLPKIRQQHRQHSNVKLNADGTFTVLFGSKDQCADARLDITPGWHFVMRVYRPGPSVLDGTYVPPAPQPANKPMTA